MEYIDVLDKEGNKTGEVRSKSDIHKHGYWHRAAHVWILNSRSELLIQRRSPQKENHPNLWDVSVAGHVSSGEDSITCGLREAEEEIGIKLHEEDFEYLFTVSVQAVLNNETYFDNEIHDIYLVRIDLDVSSMILQKQEVAEVKFVHFRELRDEIQKNPSLFVGHKEEYEKLFEYLEKHFV